MTNPPILSADQLPTLGDIRLLYVPAADEHAEGITAVPINEWIETAKQSRTGFDDLAYWQGEIEALGIGPDALTVVIDDGRLTEAARVWFILQYFGLPTAVLSGGLPELTQRPAQCAPATDGIVLRPGLGRVGLMARQELQGALDKVQVFDARTKAEFRGEDLKGNPRGGHLPGAAHLNHQDLLDGRHLRPASELAQMMASAGITGTGGPVVTHCNGGGRAALAALAALAAGQEDVSVYYLSFADWAADESCALE